MSQELYYVAPSDRTFDEIKNAAISIWNGYDDTHGYATEKKERIENIGNVRDNYAFIIAMFDHWNAMKLASMLSKEAREEVEKHI